MISARLITLLCAICLSGALGCHTPGPENPDAWEGMNRPVFSFNDGVDRYALEPLSKGWEFITPKGFRVALDKFFKNWTFLVRFTSNLGQGELKQSGSELVRFVANTTVGILGFWDPATHWGMPKYNEDFGQMFGRWGLGPGYYWVIPFIGPSSPRDGLGFVFDSFLTLPPYSTIPRLINGRAIAGPQVDLAREAALDYYVFVRDAHVQNRAARVRNEDREDDGDDLYDLPEEDLYDVDEDFYELPDPNQPSDDEVPHDDPNSPNPAQLGL